VGVQQSVSWGLIIHPTVRVSGPQIVEVDGVEFRLSLVSTMDASYLASQITFVANENVDGGMVGCRTPKYEQHHNRHHYSTSCK
jgi:hypothetical protein